MSFASKKKLDVDYYNFADMVEKLREKGYFQEFYSSLIEYSSYFRVFSAESKPLSKEIIKELKSLSKDIKKVKCTP